MPSSSLLSENPRVKLVGSFAELISTPFENGVNALCWPRELEGDFNEVVQHLRSGEGIVTLDETMLLSLPLSVAGMLAVRQMLDDLQLLQAQELGPVLNCIHGYPLDEDAGPVPTHVVSFHADSAPVEADTWLCTYYGPCSEGLKNEDARKRVDVPETREELLKIHGGKDDAEFLEFLNENCYDLHYVPFKHAEPYPFGVGNLWRIAVEYPDSPVPPCIHRAPDTIPGDPPRLLLIS